MTASTPESRTTKFRSFTSCVLFALVAAPGLCGGGSPPASGLESLMARDPALLAESSDVESLPSLATELLHLVRGELRSRGEEPPADLLRRLEGQLEPLAHPDATSHPRYRDWWREAAASLALLQKKERRSNVVDAMTAVTAAAVPGNDLCANAIALVDPPVTGDTTEATNDGGASCGDSSLSPDVWFEYTAPADGVAVFDTFGSSYDTVLSLHTQCPSGPDLFEIACSDDASGTLQSQVGVQVTNGETLLVRVAGLSGASGEFQLDLDDSGGAIAGRVVKSGTNAPRTDADLRLYTSSGLFRQFTRTSPEGTYLFAGIDPGDHLVYVLDDLLVNEVWDDHPCPRCLVTVGDPIPVGSNLVQGIDFALEPGGTISGTLVDATTSDPLSFTTVHAFADNGQFAASGRSDSTGHYAISGLGEGDHFVVTSSSSHKDEVYDDVPCPSGCDPTTGAPVSVLAGKTTGGIDFALLELGKLSGHVTASASGAPLPGIRVRVFNDLGFRQATGLSGADGNYLVTRLEDGDYTVATDDFEYFDELYDDLPCEPSCDVKTGVPVTVSAGTTANGIDFSLRSLGRIEGVVLDEETGQPVDSFPGDVHVFDQAGSFVRSHRIGSDGTYRAAGLAEGSYFARVSLFSFVDSTYEEELFDDIGCDPSCNVTLGDPIPVLLETTTVGVDFHLLECTLSSQLELDHQIVISERTFEACRSILVGPETTFTASSDVTLIARRTVEFRDGFQIESGGSLRVVIDPDVGKPE